MRLDKTAKSNVVVYHGSRDQFTHFDLAHSGTGNDQNGPGIYFTTVKDDAMNYGSYLITATLHLNKIITSSKRPIKQVIEKLINMSPDKDDVLMDYDENPRIAFRDAVNGYMHLNAKEAYEMLWFDFYKKDNKLYCENMASLGYDAVKVEVNGGYHYIVLDLASIEIINYEHLPEDD